MHLLATTGATWAWAGPLVAALFVGLLVLCWLWPYLPVRAFFWVLARTIYRVRVFSRARLPAQGPVLLVCNHGSYLDAMLLLALQRRPVRFLIWSPFVRLPFLRVLLRLAGAIPINKKAGPRGVIRSLRTAAEALARGEVVCLFTEGGVTRSGFVLPFHRAFEQVLKRAPAPVVPVCVDLPWGSLFNTRGYKVLWKWPQMLPYPVSVAFGEPMSHEVTAVEVRLAIEQLSADCAIARNDERLPAHRQFVRMAARHPFRPCMIDSLNRGKMYRYGEVLTGAWLFADLLRPTLADDSMVGVWLPPGIGGAFANIALAFLGKVSVNLNYTSSPSVVQSAIRQCGIRKVLTARAFTARMALDPGPGVEVVYVDDLRSKVTTAQRLRTFLKVVMLPSFVLDRLLGLHRHRPDDLATIIFSSGSTGDPKGVMLLHRNIAANTESVIQALDPRPSDRILGVLPFFHSFGYTVTIWVPLLVGASLVYHADPRQAREIGELCRTFHCTIWLTTPTFLRLCLRRCESDDFKTLRYLICGAEKLPAPLAREFEQKFGVLPLEGYGCTELSPVATTNIPDWREAGACQINHKLGSIGQPIPGVAARIVHPDTFAPVPAGGEGLLLMYGGNVMAGYLGRPEATAAALHNGWYRTGDIARFDEDGFIIITDRLSRFSKIGGEMVPHQKIEDELHTLLDTHDRTFVVTAVPDERKGERLVVLHTPLNGSGVGELCQSLNKRGLPNLWLPSERDFFEVPEIPVLGSGKLDLKRVREIALENVQRSTLERSRFNV
ncbi:MAG TPA: AMP-binding protein [Gemmataceae bacterium]|nr:AMP-binding protein [Gemmataceae bacterium]